MTAKPKYRPGDILTNTKGQDVEIIGTTAEGFHYLGRILGSLNDRSMWTGSVAQVDAMSLDVLTRAERLHRALEDLRGLDRKAEAERAKRSASQLERLVAYLESLESLPAEVKE